jgi:hypothetical protein
MWVTVIAAVASAVLVFAMALLWAAADEGEADDE